MTKIVIPKTISTKCRYLDLIPPSCVSKPTHFASHVWSSPFLDLISSLRDYIGSQKVDLSKNFVEEFYIWIDIFAVNQHRDSGMQGADLSCLHIAIKESMETLVCIDENSLILTRFLFIFVTIFLHFFVIYINFLILGFGVCLKFGTVFCWMSKN